MAGIPLLMLGLILSGPGYAATAPARPVVTGYVYAQNTLLEPGQVDGHGLTRINYAFARIADGRMVAGYATDAENLARLTALRRENAALKVLIAVGGWAWSDGFSEMALTRQSRAMFIQSVMDFLTRYDLDGLDVDWEYPGMSGAGHAFRSADKQNFTLLLKELRQRFDRETAKTHRQLYLTIAAGASDEYLDHTEMAKVQQYVDAVNLMAYDYYDDGADAVTGHHAPLFTGQTDPEGESADASVMAYEKAGVPAAKIVLGMPFYGRVWRDVANVHHGLGQPGKMVQGGNAPYSMITQTMLGHGFTRYWDANAEAPYLYSEEKHEFVSYEDTESITAKCKYVLSHKLGGVMFWSYMSDPSGELLGAIDATLYPKAAGVAKH